MTSRRAYNAFRKMRPGSIGGQSRIASPVSPSSFAKPIGTAPSPAEVEPDVVLTFDWYERWDSATLAWDAQVENLISTEPGHLILNFMVSAAATGPDSDGDFTLRLDDEAFTSGFVQLHTKVATGTDNLSWDWGGDTAAAVSLSIGVLADGYAFVSTGYDQEIGTSSMSLGGFASAGSDIVLFVWSEEGSTIDDADLIFRVDNLSGIGALEAWYFDSGSLAALSGDAVSGVLLYVSAVAIG